MGREGGSGGGTGCDAAAATGNDGGCVVSAGVVVFLLMLDVILGGSNFVVCGVIAFAAGIGDAKTVEGVRYDFEILG